MDYNIGSSSLKLESHIFLPEDLFNEYLVEKDFPQLTQLIQQKFKVVLNDDGCPLTRFPFCERTVKQLLYVVRLYLEDDKRYSCEDYKTLFIETAKALRTYAVTEDTRKYLNKPEFYERIRQIIQKFCTEEQPELYHKFIFQLLLNILTLDDAVSPMHDVLFHQVAQYFMKFTSHSFECYEATALIWNMKKLHKPLRNKEVIKRVINLFMAVEDPNEYLGFLMAKFVSEECFWQHYDWFSPAERGACLGILKLLWYKKHIRFSKNCIQRLINIFNNTSNVMMTLVSNDDAEAAYEVGVSVELLSAASSMEAVLEEFDQENKKKDLLVSASALLLTAHNAGKMPGINKFTPVVKLGQFRNPTEDLKRNPAFGFKADLVRLIGNLCYRNKELQDLAREAELIPVLLDCCNMDARNPFIIQWVTFAIRNLCEGNVENQKVIASLQRQGQISSEVLEEIGITLHADQSGDIVLKGFHGNT